MTHKSPTPMPHRTIPAAYQVDEGCREVCTLRVSKTTGEIRLDPYIAGACVISLEESEALTMRNTLTEWLAAWTTPSAEGSTMREHYSTLIELRPAPWSATHRTIPATCHTHRGCRGFCNLRLSRAQGEIMLDPHVTGSCVISLDEDAARSLRDTLTEWLSA
jgi:hypothetical protein